MIIRVVDAEIVEKTIALVIVPERVRAIVHGTVANGTVPVVGEVAGLAVERVLEIVLAIVS